MTVQYPSAKLFLIRWIPKATPMPDFQSPSKIEAADLKKRLRAEGFEIYRTLTDRVILAERVRDNLIMDSGVAAGTELSVQIVVRAQASHFPGATADAVLAKAQGLAEPFAARGYAKGETATSQLKDPSDPNRSLDTSFEISLSRTSDSVEALFTELRAALGERRYTGED